MSEEQKLILNTNSREDLVRADFEKVIDKLYHFDLRHQYMLGRNPWTGDGDYQIESMEHMWKGFYEASKLYGAGIESIKPTRTINLPKEKYKLVETTTCVVGNLYGPSYYVSKINIFKNNEGEYYHYKTMESILNMQGYLVNYV